jgi:hypothetical protein
MSNLTEIEIFDRMAENLRLAAQHCDELAVYSRKGQPYEDLRDELELIEGCCQQASAHREDTRWLPIGLLMRECHDKAGGWLRGYKIDGETVALAMGEMNQNFVELAKHLRSLLDKVEELRTRRTGVKGMILPYMPPEQRNVSHSGYSRGGIIIPEGVRLQ